MDSLENGATTPWLATAWAWSNNDRTLTFTIRSGVKWSDGVAFSAKDVLFSFNLLKKYPALDLNGDWSVLSSVSAKGSDQVVFKFKTAAVPYFYYIADQTPIVPEHIWSTIKDPVTYLDPHPIGTGPYVMHTCDGANIQYTKNPTYWQPGLPHIETVNFPSYLSNNTANADLASGVDQWGSQYIPNIKAYYLSKNPNYHIWFAPTYNVNIYINLTNPILSNLAVRQAMAYAIDRPAVSTIGESGYEPPSNQTSIVKPTFSSWYDAAQAAQYGNAYAYDPAKAISILKAAGYKKGSNGIFAKDGKQLSFTIINNGGYSDWVAAVNVIETDLKAVGISITAGQPLVHDLAGRPLHGSLPARLQLGLGWADALLRAAGTALLAQHGTDRHVGRRRLGAVHQPLDRCPLRAVRLDDERRRPAHGRRRAPEGHARGRAGDPGHRGRRLVPVRHPAHRGMGDAEQPVRAAQPVPVARLGRRALAPVRQVARRFQPEL